ncbi:MAG: ABC transporter permease subunit, partial [Rhodobacteraceae bacterium]|nr:ABC transporter permease subunit [Paracoccaceae bacterium]
SPLLHFLVWFEKLLLATPWPLILIVLCGLAWVGSRSMKITVGTFLAFILIGYFDMWEETMATLAIISVATVVCIVIGIPLGILMSKSDRIQSVITPILDIMQTIPSFVYLIPVVMLLGIGKVPGLIAVCIYAIPPIVRLTNLGIRLVDREVLEAAEAFGASPRQKLFDVQIPLALPNIFAGVNQTIMMALGLAVLATFIGAGGLGEEVWKALQRLKVGWSLEGGLSIVFMAIIFDRLSLAMSAQDHGGRIVDPSQMRFRLLPQRWLHWQPARIVETGINAIWDAVAAVSIALTRAIAGGLGVIAGLAGPERGANLRLWLKERPGLVIGLFIILAIYAWDAWVSPIPNYPRDWRISLRGPVDDAVKWLAV